MGKKINRRSFIKRLRMLVGVSYIAPLSLVQPNTPAIVSTAPIIGNIWVDPNTIAGEALCILEDSIAYSAQKLANNIDEYVIEKIKREKRRDKNE